MVSNPVFKGHSESWIAGYKSVEGKYRVELARERLDHEVTKWHAEQDRIDHDMWIWTQGVIVGCVLVIVAYFVGKL